MNDLFEKLGSLGVVPVVSLDRVEDAEPLAAALIEGGLPCAEITFRTAAARESIARVSTRFPEMLLGAGTVLTVDQAKQAKDAGAVFAVTPGFDEQVVDWCLANKLPILPGVVTPTEINMALRKGLDRLKFFPAEACGGIRLLKSLGPPYGSVRFVPTGGINSDNLGNYLTLPNVIACGGSWMVGKKLISAGDFEKIARITSEAVALVGRIRE